MALLTLPASPVKNLFQTYSLSITELNALITDANFKDSIKNKNIVCKYINSDSGQLFFLNFPAGNPGDTVTALGFFSIASKSSFLLSSITVYDKQYGQYIISRNSIPNVSLYDIAIQNLTPGAFFNAVSYSGIASGQIAKGNTDHILYYCNGATGTDTVISYGAGIDLQLNGLMDDKVTGILNHWKIQAYYVTPDESEMYMVGRFGTSFKGQSLPPVSTGANYMVNPYRIIKINLSTNIITHITDIQITDQNDYINSCVLCSSDNAFIIMSGARLQAYDVTSGAILWNKTYDVTGAPVAHSRESRKLYETSNKFYVNVVKFDGSFVDPSTNSFSPIRINASNGTIDNTFPIRPTAIGTASYVWAMSRDRSKAIVTNSSFSQVSVFNGNSWSTVTPASCYSVHILNDGRFFTTETYGETYRYDANLTNKTLVFNSGLSSESGQFMFDDGVSIYAPYRIFDSGLSQVFDYFRKFNINTLAEDTGFTGVMYTAAATFNITGKQYFLTSYPGQANNPVIKYLSRANNVKKDTIFTIKKSTREIVRSIQTSFASQYPGNYPQTSSFAPNLVFYPESNKITVANIFTGVKDTSFPVLNGASISILKIFGKYLYFTKSPTGSSFTDNAGSGNLSYFISRIDLQTKQVDRTWGFTPSSIGMTENIYESQNYIYYVNYSNTQDTIVTRCHKVTGATSIVNIGNVTGMRLNTPIYPYGASSILVYGERRSSGYSDTLGSPYRILDEATLNPVGTQPNFSDIIDQGFYAPISGELIAYCTNSIIKKYNLSDATVNYQKSFANENNSTGSPDFDTFYPSMFYCIDQDSDGSFLYSGAMTANPGFGSSTTAIANIAYSGILRFKPFGIINNE